MWNQLQKALSNKGMTIYELSKKTGIHQNTLRNFKAGTSTNPSFKTIEKIADALEISTDVFRERTFMKDDLNVRVKVANYEEFEKLYEDLNKILEALDSFEFEVEEVKEDENE